jgi:ABC-type Fe3+/spermidine/putrescine transport system ATPase subunit
VQNLSGGERQRTALARVVASGCKYLILDEPLSALHESLKKELWYLLKDLQRRYDLAILMVTHDLEEAFFLGDTISIIIDGRLHQQGSKAEVYHRPASIEVARFLGIGNLFRGTVESRTRDYLSVYCEDIGTTLRISTYAMTSTTADPASVVAGIRSEDVLILMPGDQGLSEINVLEGTIRDVHENGAARTIIATCAPYSTSLEVIVPRGMSRELNASKGKSIVLRLPAEHMFLIQ